MAKKPAAAKTAETPAQTQPAPQQKKVTFLTMKHWATGTVNETGEPVLIVESAEGANVGIRISPKFAADIARALADIVTKKAPGTTN